MTAETGGVILSTLPAVLARAAATADRGLSFWRRGREVSRVPYARLCDEATRTAATLVDHIPGKGERVGLVFPTSAEFVASFFAVTLAGGVPVPLPPPARLSSAGKFGARIRAALEQSRISLLLVARGLEPLVRAALTATRSSPVVLSPADAPAARSHWREPAPDEPAFIQYTSGTTDSAKGVVLTHAQVVATLRAIQQALAMGPDDVGCGWLPLFHDMGLVGYVLGAMYGGIDLALMSPEDFLVDPRHWLTAIGQTRASIIAAPNWAYGHCVRALRSAGRFHTDLSRCRVAINGAEMVDASTVRRFVEHCQPLGFRPEAMLPAYGLAEAGLAVTFARRGRGLTSIWVQRAGLDERVARLSAPGASDAKEIVCVGHAVAGMAISIRGTDGCEVGERRVGEIVIRGASVSAGYEGAVPDAGRRRPGNWLPTGDLGFVHDGELYVTGRLKDVIIVRGRTVYAHDVERVVSALDSEHAGAVMAIGLPAEDTEDVVVLVESRVAIDGGRATMRRRICETLSAVLDVSPRDVVFVRPGSLPRTSSGKLVRYRGRTLYHEVAARTQLREMRSGGAPCVPS
jgi:fatty-acyl-CoA synthase